MDVLDDFRHKVDQAVDKVVETAVEVVETVDEFVDEAIETVGEVMGKIIPVYDEPEGSPDCIDLERWQSVLDANKLVTQISIPGTHDSATGCDLMVVVPVVQTQKWDLEEQLRFGVRYFDLRGYINRYGQVDACHGIPLLEGFKEIFTKMYDFLRTHPTEFLLVQVAHETGRFLDEMPDEDFAERFWQTIQPHVEEFWNLEETVPTIERLRGRIQLVRRFRTRRQHNAGIDVNGFDTSDTSKPKRIIQDYFEMDTNGHNLEEGMNEKTRRIRKQMADSDSADPDVLCLNFTSAVHGIGDPKTYAIHMGMGEGTFGLNQRFKDALKQDFQFDGNGRRPGGGPIKLGVVLMDYMNKELSRLIIRTNDVFWPYSDMSSDTIEWGGYLPRTTSLWSKNGIFRLTVQEDGNLVLYKRQDQGRKVIWSTGTHQSANVMSLRVQVDGNLVLYGQGGKSLWASNTFTNKRTKLIMQDDGNVVLYAGGGEAIWATGTDGK